MTKRLSDQNRNPLEPGVEAAVSKMRRELDAIERVTGNVAPLGMRPLTAREKLMRSLAQPPATWTPDQKVWVMKQMLRMRGK